jgi:hypothetical protein
MEGHPPTAETPAVWTDFNAQGWAGAGDTAFYVLDATALTLAQPETGKRVFLGIMMNRELFLAGSQRLNTSLLGSSQDGERYQCLVRSTVVPSLHLCRKGLGPNNSFKPNPLRGSA